MKNKLKFRVWDKSRNCFIDKKIINIDGVDINFGEYYIDLDGNPRFLNYDSLDLDNNVIVQQYTTAHDKNGKEIYEGDIIRYRDKIGRVEFFASMYICCWDDQTDYELAYMMIGDIEVIGNIFETPDLLK